jgi:RNA polymerase sigma-70 factor (ECF subfamily)
LAAKRETSGLPLEHPDAQEEYERQQIEAFVRGEMSGFKFIYNRHRQQVYSYCLYYTGEKVAAEDAFQEVFTRVYTHRDQLREPKALKSWLLLITRSVCLNSLRTSKFTPDFVPISSESNTEHERPEPKELTIDPRESQSSGELLKLALARLAPMYREAFLLREFEGYSYDEIAEQVGISVMNVKVRITRAKKQLRTILSPHFGNKQTKRRKTKGASTEISDGVLESDLEGDEDESPEGATTEETLAEEETGEARRGTDDSGENDAVMDSQPSGKRNLLRDEQEEFDDGE